MMVTRDWRRIIKYYVFILVFWSLFRYLLRLPEVIDELWFKPVIWLVPLFWWQVSDVRKRVILFKGKPAKAAVWGLMVGLFYYAVVKMVTKTSWLDFSWSQIGISFATAVIEEVTFAGIILPRLLAETKKINISLAVVAVMFALTRLPINLFVFHLSLTAVIGAFGLAFFVGLVNGFVRLRSDSTFAAIIAHFMYLVAVV